MASSALPGGLPTGEAVGTCRVRSSLTARIEFCIVRCPGLCTAAWMICVSLTLSQVVRLSTIGSSAPQQASAARQALGRVAHAERTSVAFCQTHAGDCSALLCRESTDAATLLQKEGSLLWQHRDRVHIVTDPVTSSISSTSVRDELAKVPSQFLASLGSSQGCRCLTCTSLPAAVFASDIHLACKAVPADCCGPSCACLTKYFAAALKPALVPTSQVPCCYHAAAGSLSKVPDTRCHH